jgi:hypothetical protein
MAARQVCSSSAGVRVGQGKHILLLETHPGFETQGGGLAPRDLDGGGSEVDADHFIAMHGEEQRVVAAPATGSDQPAGWRRAGAFQQGGEGWGGISQIPAVQAIAVQPVPELGLGRILFNRFVHRASPAA